MLTYDRNIKLSGRWLKLNARIFQAVKKKSEAPSMWATKVYLRFFFLIEGMLLINWKSLYNFLNKYLLMTPILNYFRIYFVFSDQGRWEPNSLSLEVQISLYLCAYDSCISLPPSFSSYLVLPGRVMGFHPSVQIILRTFQ